MVGLHIVKRMLVASGFVQHCHRNGNLQPWRCVTPSRPFFVMARMSHTHALRDMLSGSAKAIPIKGNDVSLLKTPSDFYEAIKDGIRNARDRVVIASLYLGTGELEAELLDGVADALAHNPTLRVTMLFDALRATRPTHESVDVRFTSSAAMISCLLLSDSAKWRKATSSQKQHRVKVALYRTPDLTRILQWFLPVRVNEVVGVCHLKAFVFDDHVLMTGANLSTSYFTNRQDRYIWFRDSPCLAQHLCFLIDTVATYSFTLRGDQNMLPSAITSSNNHAFRGRMASSVHQLLLPSLPLVRSYCQSSEVEEEWDTWLFPTVQMGPLGIHQDVDCTLALLEGIPSGTRVQLSSAYFNLTPEYESVLLRAAERNDVEILTASPRVSSPVILGCQRFANGFYGSSGVLRFIPRAYSLLEQNLYERAQQIEAVISGHSSGASGDLMQHSPERTGALSIYEYERCGWTFHAKGLWCTLPGDIHGPTVTLIGSSNFGYRSRDRDLEAQIFLVTTNSRLSDRLKNERDALYARAVKVDASSFSDSERAGGYMAAMASRLVRSWL